MSLLIHTQCDEADQVFFCIYIEGSVSRKLPDTVLGADCGRGSRQANEKKLQAVDIDPSLWGSSNFWKNKGVGGL